MTIVQNTVVFVKERLEGAEGGHDWQHTERVWKTARYIRGKEGKGDLLTIELAALLHDISDAKFNGGDVEKGSRMAGAFLAQQGLEQEKVDHIRAIIKHVSYKGGIAQDQINSMEFRIVQDADRLDAIGAIGIARAFNYGGYKNRPIHDPEVEPREYDNTEAYYNSGAPTITHFYEKLLKLRDLMNTSTGKLMAEERHEFMLAYLERFFQEIDPENQPVRKGS